ncbi:MAG: hypothetical protein V3V34_11670 [Kiloniellales bacterium]
MNYYSMEMVQDEFGEWVETQVADELKDERDDAETQLAAAQAEIVELEAKLADAEARIVELEAEIL